MSRMERTCCNNDSSYYHKMNWYNKQLEYEGLVMVYECGSTMLTICGMVVVVFFDFLFYGLTFLQAIQENIKMVETWNTQHW